MSGDSLRKDKVRVYKDNAGEWRWQRYDGYNGEPVSDSNEGYSDKAYAVDRAKEYNRHCEIVVDDG